MSPMPGPAILNCQIQKNNRKDTDMGHGDISKDSRKGKHLTRDDRLQIEALRNYHLPANEIALLLGRSKRTIEHELKRGKVEHRKSDWSMKTVYNAYRAQDVHDLCASLKGPQMKIDRNRKIERYIPAG